jgi:hypothetical protein
MIRDSILKKLDKLGSDIVYDMKNALIMGGKGGSRFIGELDYKVYSDDMPELVIEMPEYGKFIDSGRIPGSKMPPHGVLQEWMIRKSIPLNKEYPIRKSISIYGIPPVPFLYKWQEIIYDINYILMEGFTEAAEIELDKIIKKIKN